MYIYIYTVYTYMRTIRRNSSSLQTLSRIAAGCLVRQIAVLFQVPGRQREGPCLDLGVQDSVLLFILAVPCFPRSHLSSKRPVLYSKPDMFQEVSRYEFHGQDHNKFALDHRKWTVILGAHAPLATRIQYISILWSKSFNKHLCNLVRHFYHHWMHPLGLLYINTEMISQPAQHLLLSEQTSGLPGCKASLSAPTLMVFV